MQSGFVTTNVLDMRAEPNHRSERVNQLLYIDIVKIEKERDGFALVVERSGYRGWVDVRFLAPLSARKASEYHRHSFVVVTALQSRLEDAHGRPLAPYVIYYGTRIVYDRIMKGNARLVTPNGATVFVKASRIQPISDNMARLVTGADVVREAKKFLGVPYLWGGVTSLGLDCSGLVQAICRRFNIAMPRDTKDQVQMGQLVDRPCIRTGDLIFFPGHVAIASGQGRIIHSSRGGGGVRIEALTPGTAPYRSDLDNSYKQARRIL